MDIKDFLSPAAALIEVRATDKVGRWSNFMMRFELSLESLTQNAHRSA